MFYFKDIFLTKEKVFFCQAAVFLGAFSSNLVFTEVLYDFSISSVHANSDET